MTAPGEERIPPSPRLLVDIMNGAGWASEDEVIACLGYLREERGLRPGAKNGPRHLSWFKTVVADYFAQKRDRELVTGTGPVAAVAGALPREVLLRNQPKLNLARHATAVKAIKPATAVPGATRGKNLMCSRNISNLAESGLTVILWPPNVHCLIKSKMSRMTLSVLS